MTDELRRLLTYLSLNMLNKIIALCCVIWTRHGMGWDRIVSYRIFFFFFFFFFFDIDCFCVVWLHSGHMTFIQRRINVYATS